jgi:hypothetical protein
MEGAMTKSGKSAAGDSGSASGKRNARGRRVGDLLPEIGRASFRRFGFVQSSIISRWAEIAGPRYAQISSPESIRFPQGQRSDGVMTLVVEPAHAPMMQHVIPDIIERTNRFFGYGAVARVILRQDRVALNQPTRKSPPSLRPVPAAVGRELKAIADPELRACLESLAGAVAASTGSPIFDDLPVIGQRAAIKSDDDAAIPAPIR